MPDMEPMGNGALPNQPCCEGGRSADSAASEAAGGGQPAQPASGAAGGDQLGAAQTAAHAYLRPSWDEYFMKLAEQVRTRTTCLRRGVGAVIVKDRRILATGYNGVPTGLRHCVETGCLRQELGVAHGMRHEICRGLHAEQNAILQAARYGINIEGSSIYITAQPCSVCAKMLINAGITEIIYRDPYPDPLSADLLAESGIKMRVFGQPEEGTGAAKTL